MITTPASTLRLTLHLLLAACLLLQGTVAMALGTTMATGDAAAHEIAVPPCHADIAPEPVDGMADQGCCSDDGGLCESVCGSAPPLVGTRVALPIHRAFDAPARPTAVVVPAWPVSTPLRPPIA